MKTWRLTALVFFFLLAGCGGTQADQDTRAQNTPQATGSDRPARTEETASRPHGLRTVVIDTSGKEKVKVLVEIADGPFEQMRGLMYRTTLGQDRGMLFVYEVEQYLSFWMKNTRIPLSIAFIDSKGRITDLLDMKPMDDKPPHYVSSEPVQYALEVNQGFFDKHGVKVGDHVELPR